MKKVLVIMAGGKSSRMKRDKALLPFAGFNSLAEYQYQRLLPYFENVYISAKKDKFNFSVEIIEDCYEDSSPLVALVSIFKRLEVKEVFVLSVDAPFVSPQTIEQIYQEADEDSDVVVATSHNGLEPLCALYRYTILNQAEAFLKENNHRLQSLLKDLKTKVVKVEKGEREFINLNHPNEYERAKSLL